MSEKTATPGPAIEPIYVSVPKSFAKDAVWLINRCTKPTKKVHTVIFSEQDINKNFYNINIEYNQMVWAISIGFLIMGFTGYFVKLIHIPINNIIVGGA
ncbi:Protein transport protein Sec61 subunit gamma [Zancudomyces culisetae]|uniref:Protein transport protein Sec61 subunit gamma n=1 Tax=Zancudomyces culisetae TaxID=1213189 RepID=A0A1R1PI37_ZANCU|nr:Protein transport protein Sec61 subunit gamma [Zancudomyces culisetae]OMH80573.1 Protein transport protein Sec61 subunit gamma [Zancudomyces culisetae]|eukprot:OMH79787.1 Protein transport protein Sec61 subunit gamma [Zancudomyces culisetae]